MDQIKIMKMTKAQMWSLDVVFAVVIFSIAITILAYTWVTLTNQLNVAYGGTAVIMQLQAQTLADQLLSPGYPSAWASSINLTKTGSWANVSVGLAVSQNNRNLSAAKVDTLISMYNENYQALKQELGIGYDYDILIRSAALNVSIGEPPGNANAKAIFVQRKSVLIDGVPGTLTVLVWTNTQLGTT